jgi:hypothetical protein
MKRMGAYVVGYLLLLGGALAGLWKVGMIERMGVGSTASGLMLVAGLGVILAAWGSGSTRSMPIEK